MHGARWATATAKPHGPDGALVWYANFWLCSGHESELAAIDCHHRRNAKAPC